MSITPTGKFGKKKVNRKRVEANWDSVNTQAAWAALPTPQKWEVVRQVLKEVIQKEFGKTDTGD